MQDWNDVDAWLRDVADHDLAATGGVRPTLVAFAAHRPLLMVRCRAFAPVDGAAALREMLDIAVPMGADRVAVSFGGTARTDGGEVGTPTRGLDARVSEILLIAVAERMDGGVDLRCALHPLGRGGYGRAARSTGPDPVGGWLARMLTDALAVAPVVPLPPAVIAARVTHSITLGHEPHLPDGQYATAQ
jgi:hypothetical protein